MAKTTDELFAEATEADYETAEPVTLAASDTEEEFQFRIDEHLRTIAIPEKGVVAGVEGDLNVNIARFTMTRYYHGRDLSKLNIRINYRNANGQVNYYTVSDATISGDSIVFSWEYAADVTQYKGNVQFVVYLFSATSAVLKQKFFTTLGTLEVLEGLEVDSSIPVSEQTDILLHLKKDLSAYAEEVKKSLPADYTAMTEQVNSLKEDLSHLSEEIANKTGTGLSTEAIDKLEEVGNYLAYITADGGAKWTELISILRNGSSGGGSGEIEVTLSSISATYTGGEVATGTELTSLTGIIVTATYSNGTTKTVTGYTLSGEILEGENTITVSYSGLTTTFTVTGIVESGGGEVTAELPIDGLVGYFDFRTCEYNNKGSGGTTLIQPTQGNGHLFTWAKDVVTEQNDYGMKISRDFMFDENGGTTQSECGESFTWVFKCYLTSLSSPMFTLDYGSLSNTHKIYYKPKYNTESSTAQVAREGLGHRLVDAYDLLILVVDKNICKLYFGNELIKEIDGNTIEGFVSWYSKLTFSIIGSNNSGYFSQLAIYNKALSDVEITEMKAYLETLEVA